MSLKEKMAKDREDNKEHIDQSGGWYKFSEGVNVFRILVEPEVLYEAYKLGICYTNCGYTGTPKYLTYLLDRKDNQIRLFKLPFKIFKTISEYQLDEDYAFDNFPMPYDIKVKAEGAGNKEVIYTTLPKKPKELTEDELGEIAGFLGRESNKTPAEIIEAMKAKQEKKEKEDGTWEKRQEEIKEAKEAHEGEIREAADDAEGEMEKEDGE